MPQSPDQILSVAQMRAAEEALLSRGTSVDALMERAGRGAAEWVWRMAAGGRVTVLCGPGNNGGDGYVIAESIRDRGGQVSVIAIMEPKTDAAKNARALYLGEVLGPESAPQGEVFVDCLFGSGLTRPLSADHAALISHLAANHRLHIAVDLPSGVSSDSGEWLNPELPGVDMTIALGAYKFAHLLMPACASMGALRLVDIGVEQVSGAAQVLTKPHLCIPADDTHKYRRGLVCVIGGEMPGAAALAAEAAARAGAGYVRLCSQAPVQTSHAVVQHRDPSFDKAAAVLIGPGLGRDRTAGKLIETALMGGVPVVADADAIRLFAEKGFGTLPHPAIVTPHEGEFALMFGDNKGNKVERTRRAAARTGSVIVHKGPDTVIAAPDGRTVVAPQSTSWLSTAGTGDVLAGLCAARLAVTGDPFSAACEAVWLHGEAARLAGASFIADDLIRHVPQALAVCL